MRGPQQQSHVTHWSRGHVTSQRPYISTFTRRKAHKLSRVVTRMTKTLHVMDTLITLSYDNHPGGSTSSSRSLLKTDRFQMIMTTLKMCSLHKESFYGDVLLSSWVFIRKKYPDNTRWRSKRNKIFFCLYIFKSVPSCQTRHMFIATW